MKKLLLGIWYLFWIPIKILIVLPIKFLVNLFTDKKQRNKVPYNPPFGFFEQNEDELNDIGNG